MRGLGVLALAAWCLTSPPAGAFAATELNTVSMTAPTAGSYVRGDTVELAASTGLGVVLASVQFQRALAGSGVWIDVGTPDTLLPYTGTWDTTALADGAYELRAVARDALGVQTASAPIAVTVDNAPPAVSISAPLDGATLTGAVTVRADASDAGSGVQTVRFERSPIDENEWVVIGTDSTSPYETVFDTSLLADGVFELRATATDAAGRQLTNSRTVTLDNTLYAPTIGFFDFVNAFASDGVVYFKPGTSGGFSVAAEPDLYADPAQLDFPVLGTGWMGGGPDATAPYEAVYSFDATAVSVAGDQEVSILENSGLRSPASPFMVVGDATPPTTTIACNGVACVRWYTSPVSVSMRAVDGGAGVANIRLTTDGTNPSRVNGLEYTAPFSVGASTTLRSRSYDALGNEEAIGVLDIGIDGTPPSGAMTAPSAGTVLTGPTALLTADAFDAGSGIHSVIFKYRRAGTGYVNIDVDRNPPFEATWALSGLAAGAYQLAVAISDEAGNRFHSPALDVTYQPPGGTLSLSSSRPRVSASRSTTTIVVPVEAHERTIVRTTLLRGKRSMFVWRSRLGAGAENLRLTMPRRVLRPGRYVLEVTATGASGKVTRRIAFRAGRL